MKKPVRTGRTRAVLLLAAAPALLAACESSDAGRLRVHAAASLADVAPALAESFPQGPVDLSYGASSALARQIRDGAPVDVFLSASPAWVDYLAEVGALRGEPVPLARNRLVCIAPPGSPLAAAGATPNAAALSAHLADDARIGIADAGVPAGEYARQALRATGSLEDLLPRFVGQRDVRAVLLAVERGELAAGFVYATDAAAADVEVLFEFDPGTHPTIEYRAAVLAHARDPEAAERFVAFLTGAETRRVLESEGFEIP